MRPIEVVMCLAADLAKKFNCHHFSDDHDISQLNHVTIDIPKGGERYRCRYYWPHLIKLEVSNPEHPTDDGIMVFQIVVVNNSVVGVTQKLSLSDPDLIDKISKALSRSYFDWLKSEPERV